MGLMPGNDPVQTVQNSLSDRELNEHQAALNRDALDFAVLSDGRVSLWDHLVDCYVSGFPNMATSVSVVDFVFLSSQ